MRFKPFAASFFVLTAALGLLTVQAASSELPADLKPRLLILTDIGGDPDDQQSLVRLLVHANEFDLEGFIATGPRAKPRKNRGPEPRPDLLLEQLHAYGQVQPQLQLHATGFPEATELLSLVKTGSAQRGRQFVGPGRSTEGSDWIIRCVDRDDPRPLNISIWGGQTDFAQALWEVKQKRGARGLADFVGRIRVYDINDQDEMLGWLIEEFAIPHYVVSLNNLERDELGSFRGMYMGGDESLTSREWIDRHVRLNHGPLGALYPPETNTHQNRHNALKEGDTPAWFAFLPFGLDLPEHPDWGGWGGRHVRNDRGIYDLARDRVGDTCDAPSTVSRWRPDFQNEFAARMEWCIKSYEEANHPPQVVLNGVPGFAPVVIAAQAGARVTLSSSGSSDPDGDALTAHWMVYGEAGTYDGPIELTSAGETAAVNVPADAAGQTVHVILSLRDHGHPPLTRYRRAVIEVQ
jgi:hypothetical protein